MKNFIFVTIMTIENAINGCKGYKKSNKAIANTDDLNQSILTDCLDDNIKKKEVYIKKSRIY